MTYKMRRMKHGRRSGRIRNNRTGVAKQILELFVDFDGNLFQDCIEIDNTCWCFD